MLTHLKSFRSWITNLPKIYDAMLCESQYLPYIARLLGYNLNSKDFNVLITDLEKKRVQIQEIMKWWRLKGVDRSISYIFQPLRIDPGVTPKLSWCRAFDGSLTWVSDPRDHTVWVPLGVIGGWGDGSTVDQNSEFAAYIPSGHKPSEYVPDSRIQVDLSEVTTPIDDIGDIVTRINEVLPYHLSFIFVNALTFEHGDLFEFEYFPILFHNSSSTFHNQSSEWHSRAGGYENIVVIEHDISITSNEFGRYVLTV